MGRALVRATTLGVATWFAIWLITTPSTSHAPPWQYAPMAWLVAVSLALAELLRSWIGR